MEKERTAWDTLQSFCHAWFELRSVEKAYSFLAEDICFVGTGEEEYANGPLEIKEYLQKDIKEIPEPFSTDLTLFYEQKLHEDTCSLAAGITLKNSLYRWRLRGFFTLMRKRGGWYICTMWFAEPGSNQRGEEHYPRALVMENNARQRQELLNNSLPGGMMGGYMEEGFPLYFVNNRMLEYLGYACEAELVLNNRKGRRRVIYEFIDDGSDTGIPKADQ